MSPLLGHTQHRLDAVGQEYEPSTRSEQSCRLRDPAFRVAPYARPVLADSQIEGVIRQWNVLCVGLDQREGQTELFLAAAGSVQLRGCQVHADRSRAEPGEPGGNICGAAAELDDVQDTDVTENAQPALRVAEKPP